jgi:DNA-binding NtrC family response regulator
MAGALMASDDKPSKPPIVVCVDDDPDMLQAVTRCLRRLTADVRSTLSARQALEWIATLEVAVLVSDYEMPEMTGAKLAGEVKQIRPDTVRILLTGRRTLDTAIDGINQGEIFRFIQKPFDTDELRREVTAAIARHVELSSINRDRDLVQRRARIEAELEAEYPGIFDIVRDPDGAYLVEPGRWDDVVDPGFDAIRDAARRHS